MRRERRTGGDAMRMRARAKTNDERDDEDDDDDDEEHRHHDDTKGDDERADGAQTGWTSTCVRGYARYMLAVVAGGGAQAASCL